MASISTASGRIFHDSLPEEDPVLDGIEARFAMSESDLSSIMRFAGTAPAHTGHDIMNFLASLTAHREESPHVDTPQPQTDPYADARTAQMVGASVAAIGSAVGSIAAGAGGGGGGAVAAPPASSTGGEAPSPSASAPVETPAPATETATTAATASTASTSASTSTSTETPPPAPPADVPAARPPWRERDSDHDGVPNGRDRCRDTARGAAVDERGCSPAPVAAADPLPEGVGYSTAEGTESAEPVVPMSRPPHASVVPGAEGEEGGETVRLGDVDVLLPGGLGDSGVGEGPVMDVPWSY